jgi:hypothetical protein
MNQANNIMQDTVKEVADPLALRNTETVARIESLPRRTVPRAND